VLKTIIKRFAPLISNIIGNGNSHGNKAQKILFFVGFFQTARTCSIALSLDIYLGRHVVVIKFPLKKAVTNDIEMLGKIE
jgi:hypothetical protein